jgi:large subunit ribosomal protein L10
MLKQEKERVVAELVERLKASDTLLIADYRGLDMKEIDAVRTKLLEHGARFSVVKNTLTKRAATEVGIEALNEFLEGPTAIAFVSEGDMVAVAKALDQSARDTKVLALKGGILQGSMITAEQVKGLASLPPTEVLHGQIVGAIVGPLNAIVGIFSAPLRDMVGIVDARIRQLEEQGEGAPPEPEAEAPAEEPAAEAEPDAEAQPKAEAEPEAEAAQEPEAEPEAEAAPEATAEEEAPEPAEAEAAASDPDGNEEE